MSVQTREEAITAVLKTLQPRIDMDLAVALNRPMKPDDMLELATAVSFASGRETDIADLRNVGGLFLQLSTSGRPVPGTMSQAFVSVVTEGLLPEDLARRLAGSVGRIGWVQEYCSPSGSWHRYGNSPSGAPGAKY